jgi:hypothetical protein
MTRLSILWRRLDQPGHESALLDFQNPCWHLRGTAVFAYGEQPCRLDYLVVAGAAWQTMSARVSGWVGERSIEIEISSDAARRWRLNGIEVPEVEGCIDVDLGFSPSTNLLPIRRLDLAVGQEANVTAAWLGFQGFSLEPLDQVYRHTDAGVYRYESAGGSFTAELTVNAVGFVTQYPGFWQVQA